MADIPNSTVAMENDICQGMEESATRQLDQETSKTVFCSPCEQWFGNVLDFIRHHAQHISGGASPCLLCRSTFPSESLLQDHYTEFHRVELDKDGGEPQHSEPEHSESEELSHMDHSYSMVEKGLQEVQEPDEETAVAEITLTVETTSEECELITSLGDTEGAVEEESLGKGSLDESPGDLDTGDVIEGVADFALLPDLGDDGGDAGVEEEKEDSTKEIPEKPEGQEVMYEDGTAVEMSEDKPEGLLDVGEGTSLLPAAGEEEDLVGIEILEQGIITADNACLPQSAQVIVNDGHIIFDYKVNEDDDFSESLDFRFISGLRHRQIHIASSNAVTDVGFHVFICLHCDFMGNESSLVSHMKQSHKDILRLERSVLEYVREVPPTKMFPENVSATEVIKLSEYHARNLEGKFESGRGSTGEVGLGGKAEGRKRYYENRTPCLCPECGKVLCRKSALRTHMLGVHSSARNHLCEVCGKAFRSASHLSQHRKTHQKKFYSCEVCEFKSDIRMAIFDHQQLHPIKCVLCHVCGTVVKSKVALTRHMMVHSKTRPFACTVEGCTWRFKSEALCKGHIEAHNSRGEFICLECKRHFRKRHHVRRHLSGVHRMTSRAEIDNHIAVETKVMPSPEHITQIPVTQLSKEHIIITTDEHGNPIFGDQVEELVFDSKTTYQHIIEQTHGHGV